MQYIERLIGSIYSACEKAGFDVLDPAINDIASKAIVSFLHSPVYNGIFDSFHLVENIKKTATHIAETKDGQPINRYRPFPWKYDFQDFEDENDYIEPWQEEPMSGDITPISSLKEEDKSSINLIFSFLPSDLQELYLKEQCSPIKYKVLPASKESIAFISRLGGLSAPYDYGYSKHVLGIKGYSGDDSNSYVVAYNDVGMIGMISLYHDTQEKAEGHNLNLDFISVSPLYEGKGIASKMTDIAVEHCKSNKIPFCLTSPTSKGAEYYYPSIVSKHCYKETLLVEPALSLAFRTMLFSSLSYEDKVMHLNHIKRYIDKNIDNIDLSNKYSLINIGSKFKIGFRENGEPVYKIVKVKGLER